MEPLGGGQRTPSDEPIPLENHRLPRATPDDESLVVKAASGSTDAFALLVERHASNVLAVLEQALCDHHLACDLAQEIWIKVYRGLEGFQAERSFRPWLFAILMNHMRDHLRSAARRGQNLPLVPCPDEVPTTTLYPLEERETRAQIEAALARVPEPYRSALQLVDVIGLGYAEAAQSLECSKGTLKSRVHRGRQAFQRAYGLATPDARPKSSSDPLRG